MKKHQDNEGDTALMEENITTEVQYVCLLPSEGDSLIAGYFAGGLTREEISIFERHRQDCLYCQDRVASLKEIFELMRKNPAQYFPKEIMEGIEARKKNQAGCMLALKARKAGGAE